MEKRKTWWLMALIGLALALVPACGSQEKKKSDVYKIFYVNHDNTGVLFTNTRRRAGIRIPCWRN